MDVKAELKRQIVGALAGANFPIGSPQDLLAAFPNGAETTCQCGDVKLRAGDAGTVLTPADFPFRSAESVADTILARALK
ncbi:MAG: MTH865 family protein [Deltaproteobacteria bacterium]|nr:MTH865 family protein [Deltaproteobacteria bacterium]